MNEEYDVYLQDTNGDDFAKIIVAKSARDALVKGFTEANKHQIDLSKLTTIESNVL